MNLRKFNNPISWFEIEISSFFFLFFSISFVFIIFHLHFWLSVIIRATMRQRSNSNKAPNINKIIIMKSWSNQDMTTTYTKYRKIIEFRVMQELQFPFATCKIPFCTFMYVLYSQNLNFCEMMLTKHNRRILKINRCYMCISYIGLNLGFSSSPYAHSLAFKRYTQIPYLLERVPVVERTPPSSN